MIRVAVLLPLRSRSGKSGTCHPPRPLRQKSCPLTGMVLVQRFKVSSPRSHAAPSGPEEKFLDFRAMLRSFCCAVPKTCRAAGHAAPSAPLKLAYMNEMALLLRFKRSNVWVMCRFSGSENSPNKPQCRSPPPLFKSINHTLHAVPSAPPKYNTGEGMVLFLRSKSRLAQTHAALPGLERSLLYTPCRGLCPSLSKSIEWFTRCVRLRFPKALLTDGMALALRCENIRRRCDGARPVSQKIKLRVHVCAFRDSKQTSITSMPRSCRPF